MAGLRIEYAGIRITELCNAGPACIDRCFSRDNDGLQPDQPLPVVQEILRRIAPHVVNVNIMGGEPGLRTDLSEILATAENLGFGRVLSTNALLFDDERLDTIVPHLDWLSLSIDGDTRLVNDGLRGKGQWEAAHNVISWFERTHPDCRLKVNTQVTRANVSHIERIPELFGVGVVSDWKLLQWTPREKAKHVADRYQVKPDVFTDTVTRMRKRYPTIKIVERAWPEPEPDTFLVRPLGTAEVNGPEYAYAVVGNVLTEPATDVFAKVAVLYQQFSSTNGIEYHESYS